MEVALFISHIKTTNLESSRPYIRIEGKNFIYETKPYEGVKDPEWKVSSEDKKAIFYLPVDAISSTNCKVSVLNYNHIREPSLIGSGNISLKELNEASKASIKVNIDDTIVEIKFKKSKQTFPTSAEKVNVNKEVDEEIIGDTIDPMLSTGHVILKIKSISVKDVVSVIHKKTDSALSVIR